MKYPLHVYHAPGAPFRIMDATDNLVATLPRTHRIEAESLVRSANAHAALEAALVSAAACMREHLAVLSKTGGGWFLRQELTKTDAAIAIAKREGRT